MEIKFEKNIPLPKLRRGSVELQDALAKMEVGDSFQLKDEKGIAQKIRDCARGVGMKITARKVDAEHVRFWRTE